MSVKSPISSHVRISYRHIILGDPGATSRDEAIFSGESLLQELKSPWELILTEPVPEVVEFRPADWTEKYFSAQSPRSSSRVTLSPSYTKWFSLFDRPAWPVQRENCRRKFQKKRFNKADEITSRNMRAGKQYFSINFLSGFIEVKSKITANVRDVYTASLFLVSGKASRVHKLSNYIPSIVEQLLKLTRCADRRCTGNATVSTERARGNDRQITVHALSCYRTKPKNPPNNMAFNSVGRSFLYNSIILAMIYPCCRSDNTSALRNYH